ncbi:MAG: hypothetical protein COB17_09595 [Sulfurimonas sp.]|nr:MAG: hypothetical protein COB17_09595 [Sulfurimonas sp.]
MSSVTEVMKMPFAHKKGEFIRVIHAEHPHGAHSSPMIQIAVSSHGDDTASMIEISYDNLDTLIEALHQSKNVYNSFTHETFHAELGASIGGGA